jgi:hypothetical protein
VVEQIVQVECYSGYKGHERPMRVHLGGHLLEVAAVEDRWYSPGFTFFRIVVDGGDHYILRHEDAQDVWCLSAFRAAARQFR